MVREPSFQLPGLCSLLLYHIILLLRVVEAEGAPRSQQGQTRNVESTSRRDCREGGQCGAVEQGERVPYHDTFGGRGGYYEVPTVVQYNSCGVAVDLILEFKFLGQIRWYTGRAGGSSSAG